MNIFKLTINNHKQMSHMRSNLPKIEVIKSTLVSVINPFRRVCILINKIKKKRESRDRICRSIISILQKKNNNRPIRFIIQIRSQW